MQRMIKNNFRSWIEFVDLFYVLLEIWAQNCETLKKQLHYGQTMLTLV